MTWKRKRCKSNFHHYKNQRLLQFIYCRQTRDGECNLVVAFLRSIVPIIVQQTMTILAIKLRLLDTDRPPVSYLWASCCLQNKFWTKIYRTFPHKVLKMPPSFDNSFWKHVFCTFSTAVFAGTRKEKMVTFWPKNLSHWRN